MSDKKCPICGCPTIYSVGLDREMCNFCAWQGGVL